MSREKMGDDPATFQDKTFQARAEAVLDAVFGGLHNAPPRVWENNGGRDHWVFVNTMHDLATFDFDRLTVFVLACHDQCVRGSVEARAPKWIQIRIWNRARDGRMSERHPTIHEAVLRWRQSGAGRKGISS